MISCDDLFGDVPHGTIVVAAMPFEQFMKNKEKPLREPAQRTLRT